MSISDLSCKLKRPVAALLSFSLIFCISSCSPKSKYPISDIVLTDSQRSWSNPEEQYAGLIGTYGFENYNGAYLVATDLDVVYMYCENDYERDGVTLVSQDTVFDIASVSKMFTAVCILKLQEKGKLDINDTIDKYFPGYEAGARITVYNLLHMNSGIPDYLNNPDPFWNISGAEAADQKISDILMDRVTDEELLSAMYQAPLEFEPGSQYQYSNTNYRLLAFIIEQVSGMRYCDYVKENIFDVVDMPHTSSMAVGDMTYVPQAYEELASYGFTDENGYTVCPNNSRGDGGIHSCLSDMLAFDRALFGGKLLNKDSMDILLSDENGYCCGLFSDADGYYHDGAAPTCSAVNKIIESEEFGHVYIITLIHDVEADTSDPDFDYMDGTGYTPGIVEENVYTNECASITLNIPEGFTMMNQSAIDMSRNANIADLDDEEDKVYSMAEVWDLVTWGYEDTIEIDFINTSLGFPGRLNFDEYDYLEYYDDFLIRICPSSWDVTTHPDEQTAVTLCGEEYIRDLVTMDVSGDYGAIYRYVRKIDDDLMCVISIAIYSDVPPEYYEVYFQ